MVSVENWPPKILIIHTTKIRQFFTFNLKFGWNARNIRLFAEWTVEVLFGKWKSSVRGGTFRSRKKAAAAFHVGNVSTMPSQNSLMMHQFSEVLSKIIIVMTPTYLIVSGIQQICLSIFFSSCELQIFGLTVAIHSYLPKVNMVPSVNDTWKIATPNLTNWDMKFIK